MKNSYEVLIEPTHCSTCHRHASSVCNLHTSLIAFTCLYVLYTMYCTNVCNLLLAICPLKVSIAVQFLHQEQGIGVLGNENKLRMNFLCSCRVCIYTIAL